MAHLYARIQTLGDSGADDAEAAHDALAEIIRLRTAIANAMELLDSHTPRPEAAFGVLICALNPDLPSAKRRAAKNAKN